MATTGNTRPKQAPPGGVASNSSYRDNTPTQRPSTDPWTPNPGMNPVALPGSAGSKAPARSGPGIPARVGGYPGTPGTGHGTIGGQKPPIGGVVTGKPIVVPPPPGTGNPIGDLSGDQRDAYAFLVDEFNQFGLGSLAPTIFNFIKQGYGADTITLLLQDTPEYKQRFAGNELRKKAGLPVLAPAQYLAVEQSYRQILQDAGMPKNFYDKPEDFANWIGGDVSATEIKDRTDLAVQNVMQAPAEYKQALSDLYGVSQGDMVAYFLDRERAVPILQLQAQASRIGGQALMRGLSDANAERLARLGISESQAAQGYSQIGESLNTMEAIANRFGTSFSQNEAEQATFNPNAVTSGENALRKQTRLQEAERGLFAGNTGSASPVGLNAGFIEH